MIERAEHSEVALGESVDTCCTCLKNRTQAVSSSHARNYQNITAYRTARWQSDML